MEENTEKITLQDKINKIIQDKVDLNEEVILELGCGQYKKIKNSITVDLINYKDVDICGDIYEVLELIPNGIIDKVYSSHFIEHLYDLPLFMVGLARIMKKNGVIDFYAPHFSNPYYFSDPTHKTPIGLYTFCYFAECSFFKRKLPTYDTDIKFDLLKVDLCFKTDRTFFIRAGMKYIFGKLFNIASYTKELYEDTFCYIFPCYEIHVVLKRK